MSKVSERVFELAKPLAESLGLSVWDVDYIKEAGAWVLRVYIDKNEGYVGIDDCEAFSRAFDPILDEEDPIPGSYTFEVSSAGAERQLKRPSDFLQFMGSNIEVKLYKAQDGIKAFNGKLIGFENGNVTAEIAGEPRTFNSADIAQVHLVCDFDI